MIARIGELNRGRKIWTVGLSQCSYQSISAFVTDLSVKIATSVIQAPIAIRCTRGRRTFNRLCRGETTNICRIDLARIFPPDGVGEIVVLSHGLSVSSQYRRSRQFAFRALIRLIRVGRSLWQTTSR